MQLSDLLLGVIVKMAVVSGGDSASDRGGYSGDSSGDSGGNS